MMGWFGDAAAASLMIDLVHVSEGLDTGPGLGRELSPKQHNEPSPGQITPLWTAETSPRMRIVDSPYILPPPNDSGRGLELAIEGHCRIKTTLRQVSTTVEDSMPAQRRRQRRTHRSRQSPALPRASSRRKCVRLRSSSQPPRILIAPRTGSFAEFGGRRMTSEDWDLTSFLPLPARKRLVANSAVSKLCWRQACGCSLRVWVTDASSTPFLTPEFMKAHEHQLCCPRPFSHCEENKA
jgi:hypothetical protein